MSAQRIRSLRLFVILTVTAAILATPIAVTQPIALAVSPSGTITTTASKYYQYLQTFSYTLSGSSSTENSTTSTTLTTTSTLTTTNTNTSTTTSPLLSPVRVDRWDWSTWNVMNGLALWITNTGTQPLDIFSLSVTIGGLSVASFLYPGPSQTCPLNPISPLSQCLFMPLPSINPTKGNFYTVVITSPDGTQTSFSATYGDRSDDPRQFTINGVSWTPTCCDYVLSIQVTNTGGAALDTNQMVALVVFNGNSLTSRSACGSIAPGTQCNLTFHVGTLTSYVIVVTDPRNGDEVYFTTPG